MCIFDCAIQTYWFLALKSTRGNDSIYENTAPKIIDILFFNLLVLYSLVNKKNIC